MTMKKKKVDKLALKKSRKAGPQRPELSGQERRTKGKLKMYLPKDASNARIREAQRARVNRAEIKRAMKTGQVSRRELMRMGVFTASGAIPLPPVSQSASPESFTSTRLYFAFVCAMIFPAYFPECFPGCSLTIPKAKTL